MPLRIGLAHTEVKLRRAHKHLEELKQAVAEFRKNGYTVRSQDDPGKGLHHSIVEIVVASDDLAALPGEFAYALRSGLDNLAWQLALLTTNTPNRCTCFPIYGNTPEPKSRYWESIADFPSEAASIVHSLQPYVRKAAFKDNLLWQLNELCNIDKHQVIAVSSSVFQVRNDGTTGSSIKEFNHAIKVTVPLAEKEKLQLNVNILSVIFGAPIDTVNTSSDFEIGIERFEEIYNFVRGKVVPPFARFF